MNDFLSINLEHFKELWNTKKKNSGYAFCYIYIYIFICVYINVYTHSIIYLNVYTHINISTQRLIRKLYRKYSM